MKLYGVWCKDIGTQGDWLRELPSKVQDGGTAILAFASEREAKRRAAVHYGFGAYSEAKAMNWCEVKPLAGEGR